MISEPAIYCGFLLAGAAVVVGWALRRSSTPMFAKILAPASLAAVAVAAPMLINSMQGMAKITTFEALPHCIDILAVAPDDATKSATLLIREDGVPVAYQIAVDNRLQDGLAEAMKALGRGDPAVLCKDEKKREDRGKGNVNKDTTGKMHIDSSLFLKTLKERGGV